MIEALLFVSLIKTPVFKKDTECLASVIYHEARGEPLSGQIQVGQVVLNRVKHKSYPNSVCKVAFQPHQFSGLYRIKYTEKEARLARSILLNRTRAQFPEATHYHADYVDPYWSSWSKLKKKGKIGRHIFYKVKV